MQQYRKFQSTVLLLAVLLVGCSTEAADDTAVQPQTAPTVSDVSDVESTPTATPLPQATAMVASNQPTVRQPRRSAPVAIAIPQLDLTEQLVPTDLNADGWLYPSETDIAWYRHSYTPGEGRTTVLAAHVNSANDPHGGPFGQLTSLEIGDAITLTDRHGTNYHYSVISSLAVRKDQLVGNWERFIHQPGTVVLVTCDGVDADGNGFRDHNWVVTAELTLVS